MTRIGSPTCSRPPASRPSQRFPVSIRKPQPLHGRSVSVRRGAAGASLEFLDYVLRLALLLDKPEVWVLLDHHFHLVCDVPRRDREAIRF